MSRRGLLENARALTLPLELAVTEASTLWVNRGAVALPVSGAPGLD
ncbi:MAG: hypothetical protein QHJ34_06990 [bacterium]|jgi:hypothetical protein|nr:hypothetical protein [candidate division KSB1 bacterium]MDH7559964.1 hypothetical protein [bacterium]